MQQGRWVSYIFRYRDNKRCENAGFIKVQRIALRSDEEARIQIGLKLYKKKPCRCKVYLLYSDKRAKYLTDMFFKAEERDTIIKRVEIPWENSMGDGIDFKSYEGILFVCDDGEKLMSLWKNEEITVDQVELNEKVVLEEKEEQVEECHSDRINNSESEVSAEAASCCERQPDTDVCQEIIDTYPKLPLFPDSQFIECVKIVPQDIGKLPVGNWRLGVNSFLSHGYYHYRYLMLGRVKFDDCEKYVIGIPGVFTNKEKYLANMFGFDLFIPVKKCSTLVGNFGYWISEVLKE